MGFSLSVTTFIFRRIMNSESHTSSRNFKEAWISYKTTRLEEKEAHQPKQVDQVAPISSLRHYLGVLSHVLDQSFRSFEDDEYLKSRIYSKYSTRTHILSYVDIESEVKQDIAKSTLVLCLRNLEKRIKNTEVLLLLLKLFLLIALPILFITTRNFSIQKNLSISA